MPTGFGSILVCSTIVFDVRVLVVEVGILFNGSDSLKYASSVNPTSIKFQWERFHENVHRPGIEPGTSWLGGGRSISE